MNVIKKSKWKILPKMLRDKNFRSLTSAEVDGELWYTVLCKPEVSRWIRSQPGEDKLWNQNIDESWMVNMNTFDVHNKMYFLIALRWSQHE